MRFVLALLLGCVCSSVLAELAVDVRPGTTVVTSLTVDSTQITTEDGDKIGDEVITERDPVVSKGKPVAVMILKSPIGFEALKVKSKCDTADVIKVLPNVFFVEKPGTHVVRFDTLSIDPFSWDDVTVTVTVGGAPPGPEPGPGPIPPGPSPFPSDFDNLAARANTLAIQMPAPARSQAVSVLLAVADKMQSFEIRRVEDAGKYLITNWPKCESPVCGQLYKLVADDAKSRLLSWQEAQHYYRTLAVGIR